MPSETRGAVTSNTTWNGSRRMAALARPWIRGCVAYGFFPTTGEMPPEQAAALIHSADERIPVADLELGVRWLRHAAQAVLA